MHKNAVAAQIGGLEQKKQAIFALQIKVEKRHSFNVNIRF
jgi:hypothetical protein